MFLSHKPNQTALSISLAHTFPSELLQTETEAERGDFRLNMDRYRYFIFNQRSVLILGILQIACAGLCVVCGLMGAAFRKNTPLSTSRTPVWGGLVSITWKALLSGHPGIRIPTECYWCVTGSYRRPLSKIWCGSSWRRIMTVDRVGQRLAEAVSRLSFAPPHFHLQSFMIIMNMKSREDGESLFKICLINLL